MTRRQISEFSKRYRLTVALWVCGFTLVVFSASALSEAHWRTLASATSAAVILSTFAIWGRRI